MLTKAYVILEENKDTQELVNHLRRKDNGTITIIDEGLEFGLIRKGDLTYADPTYVDAVKDTNLPLVYYHYIQPMYRKDARKWRASLSSKR